MKRVILFIIAFVAGVVAQDGYRECSVYSPCEKEPSAVEPMPVEQQGAPAQKYGPARAVAGNGFYFDMTLGGTFRHLEATVVKRRKSSDGLADGCHFERDGRYVCEKNKPAKKEKEDEVGYTGVGTLIDARFGGHFGKIIAFFANVELEFTEGSVSGWDDKDIDPGSVFLGAGPGITIFPFGLQDDGLKNMYFGFAGNFLLGSGGGIGAINVNLMGELGYVWEVSDRMFAGVAVGADVMSLSDIGEDHKDASGFSIWIGLKLMRK